MTVSKQKRRAQKCGLRLKWKGSAGAAPISQRVAQGYLLLLEDLYTCSVLD